MAKKTQKKPSRNVLVLAQEVTKGRGKNKRTEVKAKKGKLGTRLFCLPTRPIKKGESRKNASFECFGSWEDAQVALLARRAAAPPAAAANPALKAMLEMQEGVKGLRGALPARGRRRGLRGTPEEHMERDGVLGHDIYLLREAAHAPEVDLDDANRLFALAREYGHRARENAEWLRGTPSADLPPWAASLVRKAHGGRLV